MGKIIKWFILFLAVFICFLITVVSLKEIVKVYDDIIDMSVEMHLEDTDKYKSSLNGCVSRLKEVNNDYYKYNIFKRILSEPDIANYDRETNNCYDQSKRMQAKLLEDDIESSIFINKDRDHAWLGVWVEATTGDFVSPKKNFQIMEIRDKNLKVIFSNPNLKKYF